jgi:hypothetical protein
VLLRRYSTPMQRRVLALACLRHRHATFSAPLTEAAQLSETNSSDYSNDSWSVIKASDTLSARIVRLLAHLRLHALEQPVSTGGERNGTMRTTERRDLAFFGWLFGAILLAVFWWSGELDPVLKWIDKIG